MKEARHGASYGAVMRLDFGAVMRRLVLMELIAPYEAGAPYAAPSAPLFPSAPHQPHYSIPISPPLQPRKGPAADGRLRRRKGPAAALQRRSAPQPTAPARVSPEAQALACHWRGPALRRGPAAKRGLSVPGCLCLYRAVSVCTGLSLSLPGCLY